MLIHPSRNELNVKLVLEASVRDPRGPRIQIIGKDSNNRVLGLKYHQYSILVFGP